MLRPARRRSGVDCEIASGGEWWRSSTGFGSRRWFVLAVAASLAFAGPRLSGSVMFAGRAPWDALTVLVVVLPVVCRRCPRGPRVVEHGRCAGRARLPRALGSTSQFLLSAGTVLLLVAVADAGSSTAAGSFPAAGP